VDPTRDRERKSSAVTMSDMEIFVFPELLYALVLANLMSPRVWAWREDPWFKDAGRMTPYRRITRLKQFIMDHYAFNLDLDTWGLTTKPREIARFQPFLDAKTIAESNALFGYEGDQYYFDIDIRTHFGLDKYEGDIIPYWKTETVEAMDAFRHRPGYSTGAGECVSLSTLYAAALFIVGGVPLRDLYLMATPLHSQNYVDLGDGILTNNRRLVTKAMWFNGTALSAQARRALENEQVTVVAHESGWLHAVYPEATIAPAAYAHFAGRLRSFLSTALTEETLGNFFRHRRELQPCFQLRTTVRGAVQYLPLERAFEYEGGCSYLVTDRTRDKLLAEVESEEFQPDPIPGRIVLNDLEEFVRRNPVDLGRESDRAQLRDRFVGSCLNAEKALSSLTRFCHVEPRLPAPDSKRHASAAEPLGLDSAMDREQIIARLEAIRDRNPVADLAFYAYRDLNRTEAEPFLLAALARNPVSRRAAAERSREEIVQRVEGLVEESIYDGPGRLAQPDEVWNYGRGDGVEKALLLANVLPGAARGAERTLRVEPDRAELTADGRRYSFPSSKGLRPQTWDLARFASGAA
jgi:hypothetical protein